MLSILTLRHLRNSLKCLPMLNSRANFLKINTNLLPAAQSFAIKSNNRANQSITNSDEWRIIYRLPLIRVASAFNRLKIPFGMLNVLGVPLVFALEQSVQLPPSTALLISSVGITTWCTLAIFSFFIQNLIGIIYVNDANDKLKLAYVDYWGKRHDVCVELIDVIPENEKSKPSQVDFYQTLCLYSNDKVKYKLLQRFGRIEDPETFASLFGE